MFDAALFPIDGSGAALGAMPALLRAADLEQTRIIVLEVIDSTQMLVAHEVPPRRGGLGEAQRAVATQRAEAEEHLAAVAAELARAGVQHVQTVVREGRPGSQIVDFAKEQNVQVVVMATHGRSGLRRTILGSVADHVLRHLSGVPLLLVRPSSE